ncbi:MAG: RlpA-like double-psi beta-barrel domain-containing protein [Desulfopila sp.]|jgi:rare lipoprotein A|nr:RlpA-like double-psi beta-barrel domain-containing protein [Desulfopila sp.]
MAYTVQRGDTIAHVTKLLGSDWQTLKERNPKAVGRSKVNGNWFLREGATVSVRPDFATALSAAQNSDGTKKAAASFPAQPDKAAQAAPGERVHTLQAGETVWELGVKVYHVDPAEILKLNNISDPRSLPIGKILRIPNPPARPEKEAVVASWYGGFHHGLPMANGQPFDMYAPTIAHKEIPLGTRVLLENPQTGEKVRATVTDRGPYIDGRDVDLSYQLAKQLSLEEQGVGSLILQVL